MDDEDKKELTPIAVAEMMKRDLSALENYESRQEVTQYLKDIFVAQRLEASSKQETLREVALSALIAKIEVGNIPVAQLLRIVEVTGRGGETDLSSILGGGGKGGINLQINNNPNDPNPNAAPVAQVPRDVTADTNRLGFVLEAMQSISEGIPTEKAQEMKKLIDLKPEKDD